MSLTEVSPVASVASPPPRPSIDGGPDGNGHGGSWALGIDLGTSFTAAGVIAGNRLETLSLGAHASTVPSAVYAGDGTTVIGDAAVLRGEALPGQLAVEFKRQFGESDPILLGDRFITAEELQRALGAWVYARACELEGGRPDEVIFTFPAHWGAYRRDAFLKLTNEITNDPTKVRIVTEPEAAAAYYGTRDRLATGTIVGVYDFGGGTFDAAILSKADDGFEVLGRPAGDDNLGGADLDVALFTLVIAQAGLSLSSLDGDDPDVASDLLRLRRNVTLAKELLSVELSTDIAVRVGSVVTSVHLTRRELEACAEPLIARTLDVFEQALRFASVEPGDLHSILLVGGASRMPRVAEMLNERWARPIALDSHPKFAICLGAAVWSRRATVSAPIVLKPVDEQPGVAPVPAALAPGARPRFRRRALIAGVAAALAVAGAVVTSFAIRSSGSTTIAGAGATSSVPTIAVTSATATTNPTTTNPTTTAVPVAATTAPAAAPTIAAGAPDMTIPAGGTAPIVLTDTSTGQPLAASTLAAVEWSSDDEGVATVSGGTVTAVAPGTANITARSGASAVTVAISVTPATTASSPGGRTATTKPKQQEPGSTPGAATTAATAATTTAATSPTTAVHKAPTTLPPTTASSALRPPPSD